MGIKITARKTKCPMDKKQEELQEECTFDNSSSAFDMQQRCQEIDNDSSFKVFVQARRERLYWQDVAGDMRKSLVEITKSERQAVRDLDRNYQGQVKSFIHMAPEKKWGIMAIASVILFIGVAFVGFSAIAKLNNFATAEVLAVAEVYEVEVTGEVTKPVSVLPKEQTTSPVDSAMALESWLNANGGSHLTNCAEDLVSYKRWIEAVAIAKQETSLCTRGIGASQKNCSGIQSGRDDRRFKIYKNHCNSLMDTAILLENNRYKNLTIDEANGIYCVNETSGVGGKCDGWSENIMAVVNEIRSLL